MATANIVATADGRLRRSSSVSWAICVAAAPGVSTAGTIYGPQRNFVTDTWQLGRCYFYFDLSLYAGVTITAATLNLYVNDLQTSAADYTIYYKDWGDTLAAADWSESLGTAASASRSGETTGQKAISLINLESLALTATSGFEVALDDETTDPSPATVVGLQFRQVEYTGATIPNLDITYTPAPIASGDGVMRTHFVPSQIGG